MELFCVKGFVVVLFDDLLEVIGFSCFSFYWVFGDKFVMYIGVMDVFVD